MPFVAYCIYAETVISHSTRRVFKSRSRGFFSGFLYYSFVTFLVFTGLPC